MMLTLSFIAIIKRGSLIINTVYIYITMYILKLEITASEIMSR